MFCLSSLGLNIEQVEFQFPNGRRKPKTNQKRKQVGKVGSGRIARLCLFILSYFFFECVTYDYDYLISWL